MTGVNDGLSVLDQSDGGLIKDQDVKGGGRDIDGFDRDVGETTVIQRMDEELVVGKDSTDSGPPKSNVAISDHDGRVPMDDEMDNRLQATA